MDKNQQLTQRVDELEADVQQLQKKLEDLKMVIKFAYFTLGIKNKFEFDI